MQNIIFFVIAALLLAGTASHFADRFGTTPATAIAPSQQNTPATQTAAGPRKVTVGKDRRGHYQVEATINGRRLDLMVDTGASVIALTQREAERLGVNPAPRDFTAQVNTANGTVIAARARLNAVEIGGIVIHDVNALIMPEGALSENLLGLSFLSRLRRYEFADGRLMMEN